MDFSKFFFYLLILFLPTQLGRHFWPDWALVNGIRIDYLSPTIYLTDLLILGILGSWIIEKIKKNRRDKYPEFKALNSGYLWGLFFASFLLLNCFLAQNQGAALYKLIKLGELGALGLYVYRTKIIQLSTHLIIQLLSISIIYSSILAWLQFINQGSVGGLFWWLGERTFNGGTPGIAQVSLGGQLFLRPYATFPHPNVLGGFMAVVLPFILVFALKWQNLGLKTFYFLVFTLGTSALFLSFSRSAILLGILGSLGILGKKIRTKWLIYLLFILYCLLSTVFILRTLDWRTEESFNLRGELNETALRMIGDYPLTGVGLNNFISRLPEFGGPIKGIRFLQPCHNVYLLVGAEMGVIGLICLIGLIWIVMKKKAPVPLKISAFVIFLLSLFDHYFYTLPQGQILATIVLASILAIDRYKKGMLESFHQNG